MDFSIFKSELFHNEKTFRTPFKVTSMCFSPQNDLIALGSKTGEVMMKRTSWKIIWKTNVSMVPAVGTECKTESSVTALHFSPSGKFVAAATSKGLLHLLDVESGKIRFSVKAAADTIVKLYWDTVRESNSCPNRFDGIPMFSKETTSAAVELAKSKPDVSREEIGFVYQRLDEDGSSFKHDEAHKEALDKTHITSKTFNESLKNTVLLAAQDDNKINVLLAGVLPYTVIDVDDVLMQYNQGIVMFYDIHYSHAFGGVSFLATTYGPFLDCHDKEMKPPKPDPKQPGQGCHTLLFNMKLDINPSMWEAAFRYIRLLFGYSLFTISMDTTKRDWEARIADLHNRFDTKTKALKIGDVLLEMLLSGSTDAAGEAFLERGLGSDGLNGIRDFSERHMPEVCRVVRGQLTAAARNLSFQRIEFEQSVEKAERYTLLSNDDSVLYGEESPAALKEKNPYLTELEKTLNILETKVRMLGVQTTTMIQELSHLTKWISITKPFAKTMKVNHLMKIKRMDIAAILMYIVKNFIQDTERSEAVVDRLFNLRKQLEKLEKDDKEKKFNELEYLEKLESIAKTERKKIEDTFQIKMSHKPIFEKDEVGMDSKEEQAANCSDLYQPGSDSESFRLGQFIAAEEEAAPALDLDRVGSFWEKELSAKALDVLPSANATFDKVLNGRAAWLNSEENRKTGLVAVLKTLADILSNPQRLHRDNSGNERKLEVHFIHEIASDAAHRGYIDAKLCNTAPADYEQEPHEVNNSIDYNGSITVSLVEKNLLSTTVLIPKMNVEDECSLRSHEYNPSKTVYQFEQTVTAQSRLAAPKIEPLGEDEAMEVDENELRIDVDTEQLNPPYDNLIEYDRVFHLHHQHLLILGKFTSNQEPTGRATRMMRYMAEKKEFYVHSSESGKSETVIEAMVVHPNTQLCAFLHEEGSKITIGDLKVEKPISSPEGRKINRKTFRDYQRRRERYREDMGVGNLNDIQYDVLVQEAMDSGRDPTGSGGEDNEEEY